jgi:hypothetical protein
MLLDLLSYKWHSMSQMLVIPHSFKKIGLHNLVVRRIFSDILLVLELKEVEKHCFKVPVHHLLTAKTSNQTSRTRAQTSTQQAYLPDMKQCQKLGQIVTFGLT